MVRRPENRMEGEAFKIHIVHILFLVISSFYTYTIQREDGMEGDVFKIQIAHLLSWFYQAIYRCTRRGYEEGKSFWNPSSTFTFSCCYMVFIAIIMMVGVIMMLTTSIKCPSSLEQNRWFLATLVALHFTPVSKPVGSFELA